MDLWSDNSSDLFTTAEVDEMYHEGRNEYRRLLQQSHQRLRDCMTPCDQDRVRVDGET